MNRRRIRSCSHRPRPAAAPALGALSLLFLSLLPLARPAAAGTEDDPARAEAIRSRYVKFEHRIPMRDGTRLFTSVYLPDDAGAHQRYPILLFRTPYGIRPYGADRYKKRLGPSEAYEREGFIFVFQDVRGRYLSEGTFVNMRPQLTPADAGPAAFDESTDTYDTIEWLLDHVAGHNGRVGQWGVSYPGFYTAAGVIGGHPALKAASPQAPIADWWWDDMHHHGAFILPLAFNFFARFGQPRPEPTTERAERFAHGTPDGYQFFLDLGPLKNADQRYFKGEIAFWNQIVAHPNYDHFWQSRNLLPHLRKVSAAVQTVGGWFDTEDLYGPLNIYRAIEEHNPGIENRLVMGPWRHGGWQRTTGESLGDADFGFATSPWYQENVELPFFLHHLKGGPEPDLPEALVFETGANRWRRFDAWPPAAAERRTLYLRAGGGLAFEPPPATDRGDEGYDAYRSDPAKPVPYTMEITAGWAKSYMTEDQRFAAWRPDVLVYRGEVLAEDLTLAGPIDATLWVATTGSDADFIVKVIDVFPGELPGDDEEDSDRIDRGGTQRLVRAEVFRARFRTSYQHPAPLVPGEITRVAFFLNDVLHTFKRGHRLMVQIQSTWFPFVDRNPQTFVANIFAAEESDFTAATHRVYRSPEHPSALSIGVLE